MKKGEWKRIWAWVKGSSSSTSLNGEIKFWELNGGVVQRVNKTGLTTLKTGGSFHRMKPNAYGRQTPNCVTSFDDIYIATGANAQSRIEVGNASTYAKSTKLTILTPKSWSDGSISAQVNTGQFKTGEAAYLFVFKADGSVSSGYPIKIGATASGGTTIDQSPSLTFTAPTTDSSYTTEISDYQKTITISGKASDDNAVQTVTYSTNNDQNGNASTGDNYVNWSVPVVVEKDSTVITTITVTDNAGQSTSKTMTITATGAVIDTNPASWVATVQTGDSAWENSSVTYSARLLVQGNHIKEAGNNIVLGFQGRSSGNYSIKSVSIAERDTTGSEGDVIDSTWSKVFFDGTAWDSSVTIEPGKEKLSNPLSLNLKPGTDYYVTFKIESPSVYLDPPSGYRELYFPSEDHSSDIDWGNNGHSVSRDFHALSKIYVSDSSSVVTAPPTPDFRLKQ
jgi:hypothetical protein